MAKENPSSPAASKHEEGRLDAHSESAFIELIWRTSAGSPERCFLLELVVDDAVDPRGGQPEAITVAA
ncbi:MAG: hypothetical protein V1755_04585 [Chloroflexota bacterium]